MISQLFQQQKKYINGFFDNLDIQNTQKILEVMQKCPGVIFFTGIGKSGIIAKKIATTMVSTGTKALYIDPTDAMHGDIGIVGEQDIFVIISKSGETDELLNLIPCIRNKGAKLISLSSKPGSRIDLACDMYLNLPLEKELCPFDLVPATSAAIQLIFGDVLAIALMQAKNFSLEDYGKNHPSGRIGKRITLKVKDLMVTGQGLPCCSPNDKLLDVLVELSDKKCGCILIVDDDKNMLGIFTDGDLRRALQEKGSQVLNMPMESLMTAACRSTGSDNLAWEVMREMEGDQHKPIMVMPVVDEGKLVGLIKMHDIIQSGL
ncbi:MAG: KpsF/GutQ family sugar-phosphate isomerase [Chlamydiota bacterium]